MKFFDINPLRHPILALAVVLRRIVLHLDQRATNPKTGDFDAPTDLPPALERFQQGELLPWKGVNFRVAKIAGGATPAIVLVPTTPTHGAKLRVMRNFRTYASRNLKQERRVRAALGQEAR